MKAKYLVFLLPFFLVSCKIGCTAETLVVQNLPPAIAGALQCKNLAQIQVDIKAVLDKTNVCPVSKEKQGPIALLACPLVAEGAVSLLGTAIPASWGCDPVLAKQGLAAMITTVCNLLPF